MALKVWKVKPGMGGSRCGGGRSEKTAVMKRHSRRIRRRQAKAACAEGMQERGRYDF